MAASWVHDDIIHAWWVIPGRLLAGEYPSSTSPDKAAVKLQTLLEAGVNSFVDLTEVGELLAYHHDLTVTHTRFPIPDQSVIADDGYDAILAHIRGELDAGRVVYVHCWGGKGRTGTVVGAWLIAKEGLGYPQVLEHLVELRRGTRKAHEPVPEIRTQHAVLERRAQR